MLSLPRNLDYLWGIVIWYHVTCTFMHVDLENNGLRGIQLFRGAGKIQLQFLTYIRLSWTMSFFPEYDLRWSILFHLVTNSAIQAMYWPNGVPRAYAVNGAGTRLPTADGEPDSNGESSQDTGARAYSYDQRPSRREYSERWADEPINGLCVSRSGHLFATMTESSISVWQTRVWH
jgi:hypothetical protein